MEYLLSFAQGGEDIVLFHLLKNVTKPIRYVDAGANDPIEISVTKFFYNMGGSGINIEPQQKYIEQLNKDRPRDINLAVGISNKAGELVLHGEGGLATFDSNNEHVAHNKVHTVPVVTLLDIFNKYVSKDEDIHFLKIDIEGWERKCLEGMDFLQFRPWVLCIEAMGLGGVSHYEEWEDLVISQNYVLLGPDGGNRFYAAAERLPELQEFRQAEELRKIYKVILYADYAADYPFNRFMLDKIRKKVAPTLNRSPFGQKVKASILKSFLWRKVISKVY